MYPEINLGPLTFQTFGLMFAIAFIVGGTILYKRLEEIGQPGDWAYEAAFAALAGGLIGSRLYFVIDNSAGIDGIGDLVSGSGLTWYGGLAGGAIAVLIWARWRGFLNLQLADAAAPALLAGQAIGRIGCQLSGDGDYGKPWNGPWAMGYPDGTVPTPPGVTVHPTPIYETILLGIGAYVLWRLRDRFRTGILFAFFMLWIGTERLLIEFLRTNDHILLGLTAAQLTSIGLIIAGLVWIVVVRNRYGSLAPADSPDGTAAGVTPK
ncbi:MAG: prolipoprotein diacylglyceryl transferase [Solirubrobacterales bacterium]|nr:prolipoprotein diacylglyceryl transferase [Solirubrobacterales bacterium]